MRLRDRLSYKQVRYTVSVAFILGLVFSAFQVTHDYKTQGQFTDLFFGTTRTYRQPLSVPYDLEEDLGTLSIIADTRPSGQEFLDRSILTLVFGVIRTLLLALALQSMFYLMLTKPLLKLTRHVKHVRKGITHRSLSVSKRHQQDEIGLLTRAFNEFQDDIEKQLYHRSLAENELRKHTQDLENRIAKRTQELQENNNALFKANKELEIARQKALHSAQLRGDQLSSLSHEIRTPLNGILGMLELTINEELSEKQYARLDLAHQSGVRLVKLLNNMLDLARLESGKAAIEQSPFDLREIIEESVVMMSQKTYSKDIPLTCDIDPTMPAKLLGDPTRISQVINNLLGNAIKFTHKGEISLSLESKSLDEDSLEVIINITDTGIGIPREALDAIFTPFTQANNDIYQRYGGSGMGLALTKELVTAMNGSIQVISREGHGSTFSIKLPLIKPENANTETVRPLMSHPIILACKESTLKRNLT